MEANNAENFIIRDGVLCSYIGPGGHVEIPEEVTEISCIAFKDSKGITSLTIPESVKKISYLALEWCTHLTTVTLHSNFEYEKNGGYTQFRWPSLTSIVFGKGVKKIDSAFRALSSVRSVTISEDVEEIEEAAFSYWKNVEEIHISDIGAWCRIRLSKPDREYMVPKGIFAHADRLYLNGTLIQDVTIPEGVTRLEMSFANYKHLTSLTVPGSVREIGARALLGCINLRSVTLSHGIHAIETEAFSRCTSLTSVTIPKSVYEFGESVFEGCSSLKTVEIPDVDTWLRICDYQSKWTDIIGTKALLSYAEEYLIAGSAIKDLILPEGTRAVPKRAFYECRTLASIEIPSSVTEIGSFAFKGCTSLTSVTIPESVEKIGYAAFSDCTSLASVTISKGVTEIDWNAFSGCTSLASVTIPEGVTEIGKGAFSGCQSLASVTIPEGVTEIGKYAFSSCTGLTSVTIPASVTKIETGAFKGCKSLTSVTIPEGVMEIGSYAFQNCWGLTSITMADSVEKIGENAFEGCTKLSEVKFSNRAFPQSLHATNLNFPYESIPEGKQLCYRLTETPSAQAIEVDGIGFFDLLPFAKEEWPRLLCACREWELVTEWRTGLDTSMTELGFGGVESGERRTVFDPADCLWGGANIIGFYKKGKTYLFRGRQKYVCNNSDEGPYRDTVNVDVTTTYIKKI